MCVLIHNPINKIVKFEDMVDISISNPDGIGLAVLYPDENKINLIRGFLPETLDSFYEIYESFHGLEMVIHFRLATSGKVNLTNCHPFQVTNDKDKFDEPDSWVNSAIAHNGVLTSVKTEIYDPALCDTAILAVMLSKMRRSARIFTLQSLSDWSNKFVYITPNKVRKFGNFIKVNGVYFSNTTWKYIYTPTKTEKTKSMVPIYQPIYTTQYCQECGIYLYRYDEIGLCYSCQAVYGINTAKDYREYIAGYLESSNES